MLVFSPLLHYQTELAFLTPRFYVQEEKELARANKRLSKAEKGTPERKKCLKTLRRVYEKISNKREDFVQKLSKNLVDNYDIICFEDCGMLVEKDLSERIHNCPFCGLSIDRDLNASINILRLGLQSVRKTDRYPSLK
ncbi:Mobile element protein [Methanosarcina horonobensis HB-1 = JCM 15518]|uniref:Mobile element protein n=1 Tax=Methanosarcina horonobensis HB-1 = JCM 15518 TaxID=1434110 RepID=A0A0E3SBH2_9EURY|nr:transposase [Methanosarcina horonobensis]AKB76628.1 Mobile element protein [Methanosarcina horonobensis HB-1 = JCM 15518]